MARAHSIHVVTLAGDIIAAFTVKHELMTWLQRRSSLSHIRIQRVTDGGSQQPGPLWTGADFLNGKGPVTHDCPLCV